MSWNSVVCGSCWWTYEFYGKHVPPCRCGYPEVKTGDEWAKAMGLLKEESCLKVAVNAPTPDQLIRAVGEAR